MAEQDPWLGIRITEMPDTGIDSRALSALLSQFADAMILAARWKLGERRPRRGPPSASERKLATIRVRSVVPGSLNIAYLEPPAVDPSVLLLPGMEPSGVTPDDVATVVLDEFDLVARSEEVEPGKEPLRRAARRFLDSASKVGDVCEFVHNSATGPVRRTRIQINQIESEPRVSVERPVRLFGHAYMVDVEPGRWRLRVRTPSEAEYTMDVAEDAKDSLPEVLDRLVRIDATERLVKGFVVGRRVDHMELLPVAEHGPERPPRSLSELAAVQGLLRAPVPDYAAMASSIWESEADVVAFVQYLSETRRAVG